MEFDFDSGDLVQYIGSDNYNALVKTRSIIPHNSFPYGLVLGTTTLVLGGDPNLAVNMTMVLVQWFNDSWNTDGMGMYSEEDPHDLMLVQKMRL